MQKHNIFATRNVSLTSNNTHMHTMADWQQYYLISSWSEIELYCREIIDHWDMDDGYNIWFDLQLKLNFMVTIPGEHFINCFIYHEHIILIIISWSPLGSRSILIRSTNISECGLCQSISSQRSINNLTTEFNYMSLALIKHMYSVTLCNIKHTCFAVWEATENMTILNTLHQKFIRKIDH